MYIKVEDIKVEGKLYTKTTTVHTNILAPENNNRRAVVLLRNGGSQKKIGSFLENL